MRKQRTGLKKEQFLTIVILMILWQLLALSVNNDILIPMPLDVARRMLADVSQQMCIRDRVYTKTRT